MRWTSFEQLRKQLAIINDYLETTVKSEKIIADAVSKGSSMVTLKEYAMKERMFRYKAIIISIYGAFEQYIEQLLSEYVRKQYGIVHKFTELNEKIQSNYVEKWKKLHGKLDYPKYSSFTEEGLVRNLFDVVCNNNNHILPECYMKNGGNYKYNVIVEMLSELGVNDTIVVEKYCAVPSDDSITYRTIIDSIDDIVDRRNSIAHTIGDPDDLLSDDILQSYLGYVIVFTEGLMRYLEDKIWEMQWVGHQNEKDKLHVFNTMKQARVLVLEDVADVSINRNQSLLICLPKGHYPRYIQTKVEGMRVRENEGDSIIEVDQIVSTKTYKGVSFRITKEAGLNNKAKVMAL